MAAGALYPRFLINQAREVLADTPILVIQGARQVGKSTVAGLLSSELPGAVQVTLEDPQTLAIARQDPTFFVTQAAEGTLIIDEAQRAPSCSYHLRPPLIGIADPDGLS